MTTNPRVDLYDLASKLYFLSVIQGHVRLPFERYTVEISGRFTSGYGNTLKVLRKDDY